eukprot:22707-Chlamydomonas_euryale.AAC.9
MINQECRCGNSAAAIRARAAAAAAWLVLSCLACQCGDLAVGRTSGVDAASWPAWTSAAGESLAAGEGTRAVVEELQDARSCAQRSRSRQ